VVKARGEQRQPLGIQNIPAVLDGAIQQVVWRTAMAVRLALMGTAVMVTKEPGKVAVAEPMVAGLGKQSLAEMGVLEELIGLVLGVAQRKGGVDRLAAAAAVK
jgi:hypothetical protein